MSHRCGGRGVKYCNMTGCGVWGNSNVDGANVYCTYWSQCLLHLLISRAWKPSTGWFFLTGTEFQHQKENHKAAKHCLSLENRIYWNSSCDWLSGGFLVQKVGGSSEKKHPVYFCHFPGVRVKVEFSEKAAGQVEMAAYFGPAVVLLLPLWSCYSRHRARCSEKSFAWCYHMKWCYHTKWCYHIKWETDLLCTGARNMPCACMCRVWQNSLPMVDLV